MAINVKPEVIKDIAEWLTCDMFVFLHKTTGEVLHYPTKLEYSGLEDMWEEVTSKIEDNRQDYIAFEPMHSSDAYRVMEGFVNEINNASTRNKFIQAIERKKPFSQFNALINSYDDLRKQWFVYRDQRYFEYVKREIGFEMDDDDFEEED